MRCRATPAATIYLFTPNLNCMKNYILTVVLFCCSVCAIAQTRTVTGKVTNAEGVPVQFATVTMKGTSTAVSADVNGNFSIQAAPNAVLVFTAAGFQSTELNIGTQTNVNSTMATQGALTEVVVTESVASKV